MLTTRVFWTAALAATVIPGVMGCSTYYDSSPRHYTDVTVYPSGGPPPHAPAHGHRRKVVYVYYPDCEVYYHVERRSYIWFEAGDWHTHDRPPAHRHVHTGTSVPIHLESDHPQAHHTEVRGRHPRGGSRGGMGSGGTYGAGVRAAGHSHGVAEATPTESAVRTVGSPSFAGRTSSPATRSDGDPEPAGPARNRGHGRPHGHEAAPGSPTEWMESARGRAQADDRRPDEAPHDRGHARAHGHEAAPGLPEESMNPARGRAQADDRRPDEAPHGRGHARAHGHEAAPGLPEESMNPARGRAQAEEVSATEKPAAVHPDAVREAEIEKSGKKRNSGPREP